MNFLEITICQIILKTHMYLEETGRTDSFERFPYLRVLTERLTIEQLDAWQCDTGTEATRYHDLLARICGGETDPDSGILYNALDLCLAAAYVPEFAAYLNYYTGNIVTIQLAAELEGVSYSSCNDILRRLQKLQKICSVDWNKNLLPLAAIEIDNALISYLTGTDELFPKLFSDRAEYFVHDAALHPLFLHQDLARNGAAWLQADSLRPKALLVSGSGGRRFLAKHIAHLLKKDLILIDMSQCRTILTPGTDEGHFWKMLIHTAFLRDAAVCFYEITASLLSTAQITPSDLVSAAVLPLAEAEIPVILCADAGIHFSADSRLSLQQFALGQLTRAEREIVFRGFSRLFELPIDCARCAVRFQLTASEIADAAALWQTSAQYQAQDFSSICNAILHREQSGMPGQLLYPAFGFETLKLPAQTKNILEQIRCAASEGYRMFEEWNLACQYPYGRAVTVLLYGPPGTGKTMTAHALAKELGTALYQIDLSHVLDKYIGETEKHLEQIFAFAQKTRPVLFFDEADALFGKRGKITDGKDRYANMEVSYILQRIEQFDGIVVLATNLYSEIDKAFLRRIKYVVKYQTPDAAARRSIWESCLPQKLPHDELDLDFLSRQFDFTGGIIKNVIYTACVMAVRDRKKLCMEHVLNAVRAEYEKQERPLTQETWGEYRDLIIHDLHL